MNNITITKLIQHDKKKNKHWTTILGTYKGLRIMGIIETNLYTMESKINWLRIAAASTPEENEIIKNKGYKSDQSIINELSNNDIEILLEQIKESELIKTHCKG